MADGSAAETRAATFLVGQGLVLVERNFRCRAGEIDLIMRDGSGLVFVEVRQRTGARFGGALESIDARKQRKLVAAAGWYLARFSHPPPCRFDAVLLDGTPDGLRWLCDAFTA